MTYDRLNAMPSNSPTQSPTQFSDVIVLGAGLAGLSAARKLAESGLRVSLIEARDRVGGRIHSVRAPGADLPVELGAEFVHGRPPELFDLIEEAGLRYFEREGDFICYENGKLGDCTFDEAFNILDELPSSPDMTFAEFLAQKQLPAHIASRARSYVEGFNGADANIIGTAALHKQQQAEEAVDGDHAFRIEEGYDRLPAFVLDRFLAAGGQLHLNTAATHLEWKPGEARVATRHSAAPEFHAPRAVIALPLGVLQARAVTISPEPQNAAHAIDRLVMGSATRITLVFKERFWIGDVPHLSFLFADDQTPPTWWSSSPHPSPTLTGWMGGPRALAAPTNAALKDRALSTLAKIFRRGDLSSLLAGFHTHDWQADPFSLGSYSYAPKGALHASDELTIPVDGTLYFAGEHTDTTGHWGTVHAALRSGLRAAAQILEAPPAP